MANLTAAEAKELLTLLSDAYKDSENLPLGKKLLKLIQIREGIENPFGKIPNIRPWFRHHRFLDPTDKTNNTFLPHHLKMAFTGRLQSENVIKEVDNAGMPIIEKQLFQVEDHSNICLGVTHCIIEHSVDGKTNYYYGFVKCVITEETGFNRKAGISKSWKKAKFAMKMGVNVNSQLISLYEKILSAPETQAKLKELEQNNNEGNRLITESIYNDAKIESFKQFCSQNMISKPASEIECNSVLAKNWRKTLTDNFRRAIVIE